MDLLDIFEMKSGTEHRKGGYKDRVSIAIGVVKNLARAEQCGAILPDAMDASKADGNRSLLSLQFLEELANCERHAKGPTAEPSKALEAKTGNVKFHRNLSYYTIGLVSFAKSNE